MKRVIRLLRELREHVESLPLRVASKLLDLEQEPVEESQSESTVAPRRSRELGGLSRKKNAIESVLGIDWEPEPEYGEKPIARHANKSLSFDAETLAEMSDLVSDSERRTQAPAPEPKRAAKPRPTEKRSLPSRREEAAEPKAVVEEEDEGSGETMAAMRSAGKIMDEDPVEELPDFDPTGSRPGPPPPSGGKIMASKSVEEGE